MAYMAKLDAALSFTFIDTHKKIPQNIAVMVNTKIDSILIPPYVRFTKKFVEESVHAIFPLAGRIVSR
jgi:hypothetical protein